MPQQFISERIVTAEGERAGTIMCAAGRITSIKPPQRIGDTDEIVDCGTLAILPGLVDAHVHINEPGRTEWEGFATATAAAAAGGTTLLVDMPLNSSPVTTTAQALAHKRAAAQGQLAVDVGFYAGLVPGNVHELPALLDAGVLGVKAFMCHSGIDDFPAATRDELLPAMQLLAQRNIPLLAHAELVSPQAAMTDPRRYADYLASRPPEFEREAIDMLLELCRETGCRTHVVHLADAGSLLKLAAARAEGLPLTVETCPHYLTFAADDIPDGATAFKCAPPIRDAANREALWQGLADGVIDFIASDHSPCPPVMKELDTGRFDLAWGGISTLGLTLSVIWTEASRRGHSLSDVVRWLASMPGDFVGQPSNLAVGTPANLVVFDPVETFVVDQLQLRCRHKLTPYNGRELFGTVRATFLRGELTSAGRGEAV